MTARDVSASGAREGVNRSHSMVDDEGRHWTMIRGDLTDDPAEMRDVAGLPPGTPVESKVAHLAFHPRVKWCERLDGWGCDMNGEEFHGHWSGVKPGSGSEWTMIREAQR